MNFFTTEPPCLIHLTYMNNDPITRKPDNRFASNMFAYCEHWKSGPQIGFDVLFRLPKIYTWDDFSLLVQGSNVRNLSRNIFGLVSVPVINSAAHFQFSPKEISEQSVNLHFCQLIDAGIYFGESPLPRCIPYWEQVKICNPN